MWVSACSLQSLPLTGGDLQASADFLDDQIRAAEAPLNHPLDQHEAVARAIASNESLRVEELSQALAQAQARAQSAELLPALTLESTYLTRTASGLTQRDGHGIRPANTPDATNLAASAAFGWNILDFGLSYVRTQQANDKALYQREQRRRAVLKMVEDTRATYWRAMTHQRIEGQMSRLRGPVSNIGVQAKAQARDSDIDALNALSFQRDLLNQQRELESLRAGLVGAPQQLRQLIGLPQQDALTLRARTPRMPERLLKLPPQEAIRIALQNRPEIRQILYELRIDEHEVKASLLQLLPGLHLGPSMMSDSSSLLLNGNWVSAAAKVSWNLISLFKYPAIRDSIEAKAELDRQRAVAIAVAISAQVYSGRERYQQARQALNTAEQILSVQRTINGHFETAAHLGRQSGQALIKERVTTILAQARRDLAYADLQAAYAGYISTLGLDPLDYGQLYGASIAEITEFLRQAEQEGHQSLAARPLPLQQNEAPAEGHQR